MDKKALLVLEYNKILDILSSFCVLDDTRSKIINLAPSSSVEEINLMQEQTDEAFSMLVKKGSVPLSPLSNPSASLKRGLAGGILSAKELLNLARILKVSRFVLKYVNEKAENDDGRVLSCARQLYTFESVENAVFDAIIDENEIADTASPLLSDIRRKIASTNNKIRDILNKIIHSPKAKYLQDAIITLRGDRFVVPVKLEYRSEIKGVVHDSSQSGSTIFVEPMAAVEANNQLRDLMALEKEEIERILYALTQKVCEKQFEIKFNYNTLIELDLIFARAKYAEKINAVKPKIATDGHILLKKARHPLLDPASTVPIDIELGKDFDTLVITGPNTGGKTVSLKTVGLFSLMAQSGLHIPASDGSKTCVFDNIFADIGDEQSIEQSLSTFSSHMVNIVSITEKVDDKSLVLFDELGAGTDPTEGAALAISILEFCRAMGAKTVATTHYSEIKMYALTTDRVENASCEFDVKSLRPTYKLLVGVPGKSNAFAISKRLGLSDTLIDRAKELLSGENIRFEDVLSELYKNRKIAEEERERAERFKRESQSLKDKVRLEEKKLLEKSDKLIEDAKQKARKIVSEAKEETDRMVKEILAAAREKDRQERDRKLEKAKGELRDKGKQLDRDIADSILIKKNDRVPKKLTVGDTVLVLTLNQKATVLTAPDKNGNLQVQAGIMKLSVNISGLQKADDNTGEQIAKKIMREKNLSLKSKDIRTEIDLRGQTVEEAIFSIDKFIDDLIIAGLKDAVIIHGKGTGALRSAIWQYLKSNKNVKSFRLGKYGEGETGVTVLELK